MMKRQEKTVDRLRSEIVSLRKRNEELKRQTNRSRKKERELRERLESLKNSEVRFRSIFEKANDAIFLMQTGKFLQCNRKTLQIFGCLSKDEIIGRCPWDFSPLLQADGRNSKERALELIEAVLKGKAQKFDWKHTRKDGTPFDAEVSLNRLAINGKEYVQAIVRDTSKQKRVEMKYKILSAAIEQSPNSTAILDMDGTVEYANSKLLEVYKLSRKKVIGQNWRSFLSKDSTLQTHLAEIRDKVLVKGEKWTGIISDKSHSGETVWRRPTVFPIKERDRKVISSVYISEDITQQQKATEALRESELRIRSLIEHTSDAVFCYEYDPPIPTGLPVRKQIKRLYGAVLMECNDTCARSYGFENAHDVRGKKLTELFGTTTESLDEFFGAFIKNGYKVVDLEAVEVLPDGSKRHYSNSGYGVVEERRLQRVWGNFRDVTERKQAESALQKSQERFSRFMNSASDSFYLLDRDLKFTDVNEKALEIIGKKRKDVIGKSITDIVPDVESSGRLEKHLEVMRTGKPFIIDHFVPHPVFGDMHFILKSFKVGEGLGVIATDITERVKIAKALQESEERLKIQFEYAPDAYYLNDTKGNVIDGNRAAEEITGYNRLELIGKNILEINLLSSDQIPKAARLLKENARGKPTGPEEFVLNRKDGGQVDVEIRSFPVRIQNQSVVLSLARDITERKKAEQKLKDSQQKLRKLAAHLQSVREEERTGIAREIHDELGQALTALKMDISWVDRNLQKDLRVLHSKTQSMKELVDRTIQEVKKISLELRPGLLDDFGLAAAMEWQAKEFQKRTGIRCELDLSLEDLSLDTERATALFRIFQESLTNVARHAKATKVKIGLARKKNCIEMKVDDNGRGIQKSHLDKSRSFGILGMKERVYFMRGEIKIEGQKGKGTKVEVKIPL